MISNRFVYSFTLACLTLFLFFSLNEGGVAQQKSPFGVTAPQAPTPVGGGFLRENLSWIYQQQAAFYNTSSVSVGCHASMAMMTTMTIIMIARVLSRSEPRPQQYGTYNSSTTGLPLFPLLLFCLFEIIFAHRKISIL